MKVKYFCTLAAISVLSLGVAVGCTNPCSAKTTSSSSSTVAQADPCASKSDPCAAKSNPCASKNNPCASKSDPCASKANPCASKSDPCASKANPCASKSDPCASKANPCAAKAQTVGGPLSQELQGKPVVVDVFATWCAGCQNIKPTLSQLKQDYADKAHFVVLDVTDKGTLQETEASAAKLGLAKFLETTKSKTSTVAVVDPATGKILAMFKNNPNKEDYTKVLDTPLTGA